MFWDQPPMKPFISDHFVLEWTGILTGVLGVHVAEMWFVEKCNKRSKVSTLSRIVSAYKGDAADDSDTPSTFVFMRHL